jgi:putative glutamine amidotransferase
VTPQRPVIGLTTYRERAAWGVWNTVADLLPAVYARAVEAAGGVPVMLPPPGDPDDPAAAAETATTVLARVDGLLVAGGADVAPARYGEAPHERTRGWREDRDAWELALLDAASAVALPVLGVCRGMQVMAVHAGGALDQHVPDLVGHEDHSPAGDAFGETRVSVREGSVLSGLVPRELTVHCHHHQAVRTHPGFDAAAWSSEGVLEAMELRGERFCVGVQWHPEMAADAGLFAALVAAARDGRITPPGPVLSL